MNSQSKLAVPQKSSRSRRNGRPVNLRKRFDKKRASASGVCTLLMYRSYLSAVFAVNFMHQEFILFHRRGLAKVEDIQIRYLQQKHGEACFLLLFVFNGRQASLYSAMKGRPASLLVRSLSEISRFPHRFLARQIAHLLNTSCRWQQLNTNFLTIEFRQIEPLKEFAGSKSHLIQETDRNLFTEFHTFNRIGSPMNAGKVTSD